MRHRGRSTWIRVASVALVVGCVASAMLAVSTIPTTDTAEAQGTTVEVSRSVKNDASPRLDSLTPLPPQGTPQQPRRVAPVADRAPSSPRPDPARQTALSVAAMPTPSVSFDGRISAGSGITPPDIIGAVGPNHYVQMTNVGFAVYNKTGTVLFGPAATSTLFTGFGGLCETTNQGDPVVLYDRLADRWLLSQFAFVGDGSAPPYFECIAISQTPDPTGAYFRYAFQFNTFPDYPKIGVWPDAYYMSINFSNFGTTVGAVALERSKMLLGQSAQMVLRTLNSPAGITGFPIPSTVTSALAPTVGTPNFYVRPAVASPSLNRLEIYQFHVDFTVPANSTFTGPTNISTAPFDANLCNFGVTLACIPQSGTAQKVDGLATIMMQPLPYRNFGAFESIVGNFPVAVGDFANHAGIRWFELRRSGGGNFALNQEATYAPDASHRWNGSIGQDRDANIALGYSLSSSSLFPSINYAGRLATDPLGTLPQSETALIAGGGSQTNSDRWGDYSAMTLDPVDDCTFWYTNEYYSVSSGTNWRTRIGAFKFPSCGTGVITPTPTATPTCILADMNCDGIVDIRDYGIWRTNFGQTNCGNVADLDGNCIVDIRDYGIWRQNFGHTGPAGPGGGAPPAGAAPAPRGTPGPAPRGSDQSSRADWARPQAEGSEFGVPVLPVVGALLGLGGLAGWRSRRPTGGE